MKPISNHRILLILTTLSILIAAAPAVAQTPNRGRPIEVLADTRSNQTRDYVKVVRVPGPPAPSFAGTYDDHRTYWFFANGGFAAQRGIYSRWRGRHNSSVLFQPNVVVHSPYGFAPGFHRGGGFSPGFQGGGRFGGQW